jgi:hypothetical protein
VKKSRVHEAWKLSASLSEIESFAALRVICARAGDVWGSPPASLVVSSLFVGTPWKSKNDSKSTTTKSRNREYQIYVHRNSTILHGTVWCVMVRYGAVWYGMVQYGTVRYGMVWYSGGSSSSSKAVCETSQHHAFSTTCGLSNCVTAHCRTAAAGTILLELRLTPAITTALERPLIEWLPYRTVPCAVRRGNWTGAQNKMSAILWNIRICIGLCEGLLLWRNQEVCGVRGTEGGDRDALTEKLKFRSGLGDIGIRERIILTLRLPD